MLIASHDGFFSKNVALQMLSFCAKLFCPHSRLSNVKERALSSEDSRLQVFTHPIISHVMLTGVLSHCGMPWSPNKSEVGQRGERGREFAINAPALFITYPGKVLS